MPQIFKNAVMTDAGRELLSRETAGECMLQITRMAIGSGIYTSGEKKKEMLQKLTMLKDEKQSVEISAIKRRDKTSIVVTATFTNDDTETAYNINEIGLFAQEKGEQGTEVLYSIAVSSEELGEVMPVGKGKDPIRIVQDWIVTVSDSANVTIQALTDGAFALAGQVGNIDDLQTEAKESIVDAVNELLHRSIITDTCGMIGDKGAEVEIQDLIDEIADRVMEKLLEKTGDSQDNIVTFTSDDNADAESWTDVSVLKAKETHKSLLQKISKMFKNVRFLYKKTKKLEIDDKINIARFKRTSNSSTQYGITVNSHAPGDLSINVGSASDTSGKIDLPFSFGFDANGNAGYKKVGADTVTPFLEKRKFRYDLGELAYNDSINIKYLKKYDTEDSVALYYLCKITGTTIALNALQELDDHTTMKIELVIPRITLDVADFLGLNAYDVSAIGTHKKIYAITHGVQYSHGILMKVKPNNEYEYCLL